MSRLIFIVSFLIISGFVFAQKQAGEIEFNPYVRFDKYPQFSKVFNGPQSTDHITMNGTSVGLNIAYKIPIKKSILLKPGIGYFEYSFNNVEKDNTRFGKSTGRDIDIVSPVYIPFFTDKYKYNTIMANIGFEKLFNCKRNTQVVTGINWNNYYAISESYHLTYNPEGSKNYGKNNNRYFGSSVYIDVSVIKKFQKIRIGPSLILPVFDNWKTDSIFPGETNSGSRSKWLNGIGLGISVNYSLAKKK
jgi:hypothetical protein